VSDRPALPLGPDDEGLGVGYPGKKEKKKNTKREGEGGYSFTLEMNRKNRLVLGLLLKKVVGGQ